MGDSWPEQFMLLVKSLAMQGQARIRHNVDNNQMSVFYVSRSHQFLYQRVLCWILCVILTFLALERGETEIERAKAQDYSETESCSVCRRSLCHTGLVDHIKCRSYVRLGLICVCPHHDVLCLTNYSDLSCCSNINCEINHVVWKMPF